MTSTRIAPAVLASMLHLTLVTLGSSLPAHARTSSAPPPVTPAATSAKPVTSPSQTTPVYSSGGISIASSPQRFATPADTPKQSARAPRHQTQHIEQPVPFRIFCRI